MEQLEGRQSVMAALAARQRRFQVILVRHDAHKIDEVLDLAGQLSVPVRRVGAEELDALAHGATHGGVVAIASAKPRLNGDELLKHIDSLDHPPMLLLLEGVDDARNLGFTLRTADALAVDAVLIKKHLWDFDPTEVARPASGAYERLPLVQLDDVELLERLKRAGLQLFGCVAGAKRSMHDVNLAEGVILAVGGEKRGLSGAVRSICDRFITIPTRAGASLSMSHAAAILLAEAARQRR